MKKLLVGLSLMFVCVASATTINLSWMVDNNTYAQTTCESGGNLNIPSTTPTKRGYHFIGWDLSHYTQLEYIESTGTQYIDTGLAPTQLSFENTEIFVDGQYVSATSSQYNFAALWGTQQSGLAWFKTDIKSASQIAVQAGGAGTETVVTVSDAFVRHQIKMDSAQTKCYVDGTAYDLTVQQPAFTLPNNITLFKSNGVSSGQYATARIYKMYIKSNGSLIRNFIPAKRNNDNVVGMYDAVTGMFFTNRGTGDFVAGPVSANQTLR